jgi:5-hydroxyisourate hydrolase
MGEIRVGRLTTPVLDGAHGKPGAGMKVTLYRRADDFHEAVKSVTTNADGRAEASLHGAARPLPARVRRGSVLPAPKLSRYPIRPFLDEVAIDFGIADAEADYHVPLRVRRGVTRRTGAASVLA